MSVYYEQAPPSHQWHDNIQWMGRSISETAHNTIRIGHSLNSPVVSWYLRPSAKLQERFEESRYVYVRENSIEW